MIKIIKNTCKVIDIEYVKNLKVGGVYKLQVNPNYKKLTATDVSIGVIIHPQMLLDLSSEVNHVAQLYMLNPNQYYFKLNKSGYNYPIEYFAIQTSKINTKELYDF